MNVFSFTLYFKSNLLNDSRKKNTRPIKKTFILFLKEGKRERKRERERERERERKRKRKRTRKFLFVCLCGLFCVWEDRTVEVVMPASIFFTGGQKAFSLGNEIMSTAPSSAASSARSKWFQSAATSAKELQRKLKEWDDVSFS